LRLAGRTVVFFTGAALRRGPADLAARGTERFDFDSEPFVAGRFATGATFRFAGESAAGA